MFFTYLLIAVLLLVVYTYFLNKRDDKSPPGPLRLPLIGSAWALGTNSFHSHVAFTNLARKFGPIYQLHIAAQPIVVITSPHLIQEAFSSVQSPVLLRFISKTAHLATNGGKSLLFNSTRHNWAVLRKASTPLPKNMPGGTPIPQIAINELKKLIAHMEKHIGKAVHLNPWFMFFTRNIFLEIAIRKSWSFDTVDEEEQKFNESMMLFMDNANHIVDFIPALDLLARKQRTIALKHGQWIKSYLMKIIKARENDYRTDETARDFLDVLVYEKKKNPEIHDDHLANSLRDILFAATLTTSDSLDWLIMYLCEYPDIQEKTFQEINGKLKGRMPTMDDKTDMPYLEAVLKEVLRLRPPAPMSLPHIADQDCVIGGYQIKKGSVVLENLYGIGNWARYYPNHTHFDPDRWIRNPEMASNLLHFGYGPTMCLGMPIAKQELFLAAATLLQKFKYKFAPGETPDFIGEFKTTFNAKPWKVVFHER